MIDLKRLKLVHEIARTGSISGASQVLNIAQPSLSAQLKELEQHFKTPLFERHARGMQPTAAGRMLVSHAERILQSVRQAELDVLHNSTILTGEVRIGLPFSVAEMCLVTLVRNLRREHENIRLHVTEDFSGALFERLVSRQLDLAVLVAAPQDRRISIMDIARERLYLVVPADWEMAKLDCVGLDELLRLPLILPSKQHGAHKLLEGHAITRGINLNVRYQVDSAYQLIKLVANGMGVTVLTPASVEFAAISEQVRIVPVVNPEIWRSLSLCHPVGPVSDPVVSAVETALLSVMREMLMTSGKYDARLTGS